MTDLVVAPSRAVAKAAAHPAAGILGWAIIMVLLLTNLYVPFFIMAGVYGLIWTWTLACNWAGKGMIDANKASQVERAWLNRELSVSKPKLDPAWASNMMELDVFRYPQHASHARAQFVNGYYDDEELERQLEVAAGEHPDEKGIVDLQPRNPFDWTTRKRMSPTVGFETQFGKVYLCRRCDHSLLNYQRQEPYLCNRCKYIDVDKKCRHAYDTKCERVICDHSRSQFWHGSRSDTVAEGLKRTDSSVARQLWLIKQYEKQNLAREQQEKAKAELKFELNAYPSIYKELT